MRVKDEEIVSLYWERNELALAETERKYGRYLMQLAYNILASREDGEESVSETYWRAWNSMPPRRPELLRAYLAKIARRVSIDRFRARHSRKRESSEYQLSLEELGDCLPGGGRRRRRRSCTASRKRSSASCARFRHRRAARLSGGIFSPIPCGMWRPTAG